MTGSDQKLYFSQKERGKACKDFIDSMNEENYLDHHVD